MTPRSSACGFPAYRPKLPCVEKLIPYLREIDKNRWYSNRGMLVQALERRITTLLGTGCGVTASGWAALKAAIFASAGASHAARPLALMPSYTFAATAAAAETCGYRPYFLDVDEEDWMISPQMLVDHPGAFKDGRCHSGCCLRSGRQTSGVETVSRGDRSSGDH